MQLRQTPLLVMALALAHSCTEHVETPPIEVTAAHVQALPTSPDDTAWSSAVTFTAELLPQDVVEPRLLESSTPSVRVRAFSDGERLAVRLAWDDATDNNLPQAATFMDACAMQLPQVVTPDVPDPQMGESDKPVEITYWRASWQAVADGRGEEIQELYPNASIDHYPFEAASLEEGSEEQRQMKLRYAPASAMGNMMARRPDMPVQDLIAVGAGSLTTNEDGQSEGSGLRTDSGWEVVLSRPLPEGLEPGGRSVIAFAIWEGSEDQVGSRKMRSVWIPITVE